MKKKLRKEVLSKRDSIIPSERKKKDILIKQKLFCLPEFKTAKAILFYASFRTEADTTDIIEESLRMGKSVFVPKVDTIEHRLQLYEIKDLRELSPGYMGIPEPSLPDQRLHEIKDVDLAIVPGVGFDRFGNRLGYGAGYYDILLSDVKKKIPFIALAYEEQLIDTIPSERHDIKVDAIVTDHQVIRASRV
ncbi:MAG: 5-formyltetrahydrofolate cyclo-ligase [Nitrospirae bacterium RBG_13_43_8]|nr:MAG: 5-formyltetrahydrofolate cyclo-ligase [Nitrospirae bacterium RBG_13_43_8]